VLHRSIEEALKQAVAAVLPEANLAAVQVRPCPDPKFGDYQSSAVMSLAKERKTNPRQLATDIVAKLDVSAWCEKVEIAGPGFLNFRLKTGAIEHVLKSEQQSIHPFIHLSDHPRTAVIDFSSPNVAKPMHVGHIRSTILGDSLARALRLLGHKVITDNHIGDWGTQFGMLIVGWKRHLDRAALQADPIAEMDRLYKLINNDPTAEEDARQELVKLQSGDPENLTIWREMIALSQTQFDTIYRRLGLRFDHTLGESFYDPHLQRIVDQFVQRGLAQESEGAQVIFFPGHPQLKEEPAMIRKRDGAFNYMTTDLATLEYRLNTWHPDEIIYVTDGRQQLHFRQLFAAFRRWHPSANVRLAHVWFGSILGEDGKPFKTRTGETVKLADLLDEAEERAFAVVTGKNPELPEPQRREIARVVGIGAVKYADLLPNRQSDYVFSWDKMLALSGNTAPYLQYAYTRIRSIFRKGEITDIQGAIKLTEPAESALAKYLLNFGIVLEAVAEEYRPNFLCNYLYELAGHFTTFYEACPILKSEPAVRSSRLALADLTGRVLKQGLEVLGIETLEQM
jgi:arginyl-tRNA synthetase